MTSTRRTALKSFAGLVGISGLASLGEANVDTKEIVIIKREGEVLKTATVSKEWYRAVKKIRNRVRRLQDTLIDVPGVEWIGYGFGNNYIHDRTRPQFAIGYDPFRLNRELPDHFEGFAVTTQEVRESSPLCVNDGDFNPVPGGVTVEGTGGYGYAGTSATQVSNPDNQVRLLTANHLITKCGGDSDGQVLQQNNRDFGTVEDADGSEDWAIVTPNSNFSTDKSVWAGTDERLPISGYYTADGVDNLACYGDGNCVTVNSMGTTTGQSFGTVQERGVMRSKCPSLNGFGVRNYMESAKGDSGGLTFNVESFNGQEYAVMINIINVGDDRNRYEKCNGKSFKQYQYHLGIPLYHLANAHDIS